MAGRKVDINKADVEQLSSLNGVGPAKAESIIEKRKVRLYTEMHLHVLCVIFVQTFSKLKGCKTI